jgi:hypothetical protein
MVMPWAGSVHAEAAIDALRPAFPQGVSAMFPNAQIWGISCAQTAIIPMNSVIDASAAASSTNVFNMTVS